MKFSNRMPAGKTFNATFLRPFGLILACLALCLSACGGGTPPPSGMPLPPGPPVNGPAWFGFARDAQHSALGAIATQPLTRVRWTTPVDLAPQYSGNTLLIHYGAPAISTRNAVVVPVKTGAGNGFRVETRLGSNGVLMWSANSDYILPAHNWTPSFNPVITAANRLFMPGAGGKLLFRDDPDSAIGAIQTAVFYGSAAYNLAPASYDSSVYINTPLTADAQGNVYFGFIVTGSNAAGLGSGIARLAADGSGIWIMASAAAGDATITRVAMNSAPALSNDGSTLYVAVNTTPVVGRPTGYLLSLDSTTLATKAKIHLDDPLSGTAAALSNDGTASPTVGPDGDVYFGVLEANAPAHNFRGWLLHFDSTLTQTKVPGSFGWDDTASIVPASMVPSYSGPASYLLMTKYNNYGGAGTGNGANRIAILDPAQSQVDTISGNQVMKEIFTILGPTPDPEFPGGVKEWCINTAAVDPLTRSVLVNSEDGYLYRWDLVTNQFSERIQLNSGIGEAYTPTAIGPDGAVYAINNAVLFSVGR